MVEAFVSFDKDYPKRKDHRRQYRDSRSFDSHCRNHGECEYCKKNRKHFDSIPRQTAEDKLREFLEEQQDNVETIDK